MPFIGKQQPAVVRGLPLRTVSMHEKGGQKRFIEWGRTVKRYARQCSHPSPIRFGAWRIRNALCQCHALNVLTPFAPISQFNVMQDCHTYSSAISSTPNRLTGMIARFRVGKVVTQYRALAWVHQTCENEDGHTMLIMLA